MATKRLTRGRPIPDSWDKVDPWGTKSQEFIAAVAAKVAARQQATEEQQREYAREQARLIRRSRPG